MVGQYNSMITRVRPVFFWLRDNAEASWAARLVKMAKDLADLTECGSVVRMELDPELKVAATAERLIWMLENKNILVPRNAERLDELRQRVADEGAVQQAIASLSAGKPIPKGNLVLEGDTNCDCLIHCEHALIWIEGKRFDYLSPSTTWDVSRDQLARNVEAAWFLAQRAGKDYRLILCHEYPLKHHEAALLDGYRQGTSEAGWPHIPEAQRREFATRIGTLTWGRMAEEWPLREHVPELRDLWPPMQRDAAGTVRARHDY
jgi:hypothetical protein